MEHSGEEKIKGQEDLYRLRHSLAHVLAQAMMDFRPGTKLGFGPPISDGFYYDFILSDPISEEDFPQIEKRMKAIIAQNQKFEFEDLPIEQALAKIDEMGEPYKREYAQDLAEKRGLKELRFYNNGKFTDMCEGPHVEHTGKIPKGVFKLRSIAGAYWRGNSDNNMMTRIYAWAFETREELRPIKKHWREIIKNWEKN
jgi:threonyl-tRNA synthetase